MEVTFKFQTVCTQVSVLFISGNLRYTQQLIIIFFQQSSLVFFGCRLGVVSQLPITSLFLCPVLLYYLELLLKGKTILHHRRVNTKDFFIKKNVLFLHYFSLTLFVKEMVSLLNTGWPVSSEVYILLCLVVINF